MNTKSDLDSKLPVKEHLKNAKKLLGMIHELDKYYIPLYFIVHLLHVIRTYAALFLSAYILDALAAGIIFEKVFGNTAVFAVIIFLCTIGENAIHERMYAEQTVIFRRYHSLTEQKMVEMDYAKVTGPDCEVLRQRINSDMNYSSGLFSIFPLMNGMVYCVLNLIGAVVVGLPAVKALFVSGQWSVWPIMLITAVVSAVTTKFNNKYAKEFAKEVSRNRWEDESLPLTLGWNFVNSDMYQYQNGKDVRIYGGYGLMKRYALDNWDAPETKEMNRKLAVCEGKQGFCYVISGHVLRGTSYLVMALLALTGAISIGNIILYAGCINNLFGEIDKLSKRVPEFFLHVRKHMSTVELLELSDEMYKGKLPVEKRSDGEYRIEFKNVSFRYPGSEQYALKNFSMQLKVGEKLAIVGMNGSGKTTMIKLLCRFYDPEEGEILLNGVDIRKFRQDQYSKLFAVVFQDFELFSLPLGENVAAASEYDREKAGKCLRDAGLAARVERLEDGLDTYLYKEYADGVEISGGEAQKIAIARAIYKDAPFVLLDEPTAALDPLSEYEVYTNFDKIIGDKTAVYISHRLSSCKFCEKIAVFHEGELVQTGSHEELLADISGKYYELWNAQAKYYQ